MSLGDGRAALCNNHLYGEDEEDQSLKLALGQPWV